MAVSSFSPESELADPEVYGIEAGRYSPLVLGENERRLILFQVWRNGMVTTPGEDPWKMAEAYVY